MAVVRKNTAGDYGKAFDNVKDALNDKAFKPGKDDSVGRDVWVLMERLERVRNISPELNGVEVSENVTGLIKLVGKKKILSRFSLKNKAASLL